MRIGVIFDTREDIPVDEIVQELKIKHNLDITFPKTGSIHQISQLTLADMVFVDVGTNKVLMMVERKGLNDFIASVQPAHLQSKRLTEQLDRMKTAGVPFLSLLLTGNYHELNDRFQRTLITKTLRLQMQNPRVDVVRLETIDHLALYICRAIEGLKGSGLPPDYGPDFHELTIAVRKAKTDTPRTLYQTSVQLASGIGPETAAEIVRKYPCICSLQSACRAEGIAAITHNVNPGSRALSTTSANLLAGFVCALPSENCISNTSTKMAVYAQTKKKGKPAFNARVNKRRKASFSEDAMRKPSGRESNPFDE
jgi:ERCC4-type nuclease